MTSPLDIITCRVGGIEGPFSQAPTGRFRSNGDPIMQRVPPFWVVRFVKTNILHDVHFASRQEAQKFWDSLPEYDSPEADARGRAQHEYLQRMNRTI